MNTVKEKLQEFLEKSSGADLGEENSTILKVLNEYGKNENYFKEDKLTIKDALEGFTSGMGVYGNPDKFPSAKVTMDSLGRPTLIEGTAKYGYERGAYKLYYQTRYSGDNWYTTTLKPVFIAKDLGNQFLINNGTRTGSENGKQIVVYCGSAITQKYEVGKGIILTKLEPMDIGFSLVAAKELTIHPGNNSFSWFTQPEEDSIKLRFSVLKGPTFQTEEEYFARATTFQSYLTGGPRYLGLFTPSNYKNDNITMSFEAGNMIITSSAEEDIVIPEGEWLCHLITSYQALQVGM